MESLLEFYKTLYESATVFPPDRIANLVIMGLFWLLFTAFYFSISETAVEKVATTWAQSLFWFILVVILFPLGFYTLVLYGIVYWISLILKENKIKI